VDPATPAATPELRDKGLHGVRVLTADGEIELRRRYFWAKGHDGLCPADKVMGIDDGRVSPGAREILCRLGMVQGFRSSTLDANRIGNVPVSRERMRQLVEGDGEAIRQARDGGQLPAAWQVEQTAAVSDKPSDMTPAPSPLYAGVDGVMAPMVTQAEKDKRRKQHAVRRQQRSAAGVGNARELPPARPGSDEKFKEMKIGVFYDQSKTHRHVLATEGDHEAFGALLKAHAALIGFDRAALTVSLTDGAKWIARQICLALLTLKVMLLDFYHLSQHVHEAALCCLGDTAAAKEWAAARLKEFKELSAGSVLAAIDALNKKVRSEAKRKNLRLLRDYIVGRLEMLDYRRAIAAGWDIGSGPTEAECKTLTLRLKRPGMKWDADHAAGMMNLVAMYESGQAAAYWKTCRAA
jgi:hypothetical protein